LSAACVTFTGLLILLPATVRVVLQIDFSSDSLLTPVSWAAISIDLEHSDITWEPSLLLAGASNLVLPRFNTALMMFMTVLMSSPLKPIACMAAIRTSNIWISSTSFNVLHVERVRKAKLDKSAKPVRSTVISSLTFSFASLWGNV